MRTPRTFLLVAILVFPVRHLSAQGGSAVPEPNCDNPAHHQFDFWIGAWDVSNPDGHAGTNTVTLEENACLIHEHWKGAEGSSGQSFNYFDGADGKWHQVWVDANGLVLVLSADYRERGRARQEAAGWARRVRVRGRIAGAHATGEEEDDQQPQTRCAHETLLTLGVHRRIHSGVLCVPRWPLWSPASSPSLATHT